MNPERNLIGKVTKYFSDVRRETKKVIWPPRSELQESAIIVIVLSLIMAVFVFIVDQILMMILKWFFLVFG